MGRLVDRLKVLISKAPSFVETTEGKPAKAMQAPRRGRAHPMQARIATVRVGIGRPEPKTPTLGEIVKRVMRDLKREHQPFARITRAWARVAPWAAGQTQVLNYQHGRLEIGVTDSALRAELQSFRKIELLDALRAREDGRDVAEIRFKLIGPRVAGPQGSPRRPAGGGGKHGRQGSAEH